MQSFWSITVSYFFRHSEKTRRALNLPLTMEKAKIERVLPVGGTFQNQR